MAPRDPSRFWRRCRVAFRRFRISLLLLILALVGALVYLNQVGLPGFAKGPLLARLRARGIDLQFTRLRWHWDQGLVAEHVLFGRPDHPSSPKLAIGEVQIRLDYSALAKLQLQVAGLVLRQGQLTWPVPETNGPARELSVQHIQAELRFLPGDLWEVDHFTATFAGANLRFSGTITNASAVRDWPVFQAAPGTTEEVSSERLRRLAEMLDRIHFTSPPQLILNVSGNARRWRTFALRAYLTAPEAETPWGTLRRGLLIATLAPAANQEPARGEVTLQAADAQTPWGAITNLALTLHLSPPGHGTNVLDADLDLTAAGVGTKWAQAAQTRFTVQWTHSLTNAMPLSGRGELRLEDAEGHWGRAQSLQLIATLATPGNPPPGDASWGWWTNLTPYALDCECRVTGLKLPKLQAEELSCTGQWQAPELRATEIAARLYDGRLIARANLDVATRKLTFSTGSDFDIRKISALLTPGGRRWLSEYSWKTPPELQGEGELILPAWTNRQPDWQMEVKPTIKLGGHVHIEEAAFRKVPAGTVDSHFNYTNEVWRLPDLAVTGPEGRLKLTLESDERTRDFLIGIRGAMHIEALRPLLEPEARRALDLVMFTQPPRIEGEVRGRWHEPDRLSATGRVAVTNFTFRGETADGFETALEYTNRFLRMLDPQVQRGTQQLAASSVNVDFVDETVLVTNGFSTTDPQAVARAIGPKVDRDLKPYRFLKAPVVHVNGIIPIHDDSKADLHFAVDGGPFEWWKFRLPWINAKIDWVHNWLTLRNVQTEFYNGAGVGNAQFDVTPHKPTDFRFQATVADSDFHLLMADLFEKTNELEGWFTAQVAITNGILEDWQSWQGHGNVDLRDGLIWQIPVFGFLSPVLDGLIPGLGSSRAKEGSATFAITNGVLRSRDLEIRASAMRLKYWGTVDMKGRLNANVEAELLRDAWVVGRVLSLALWPVSKIFEYRITGTLFQPKSAPVFIVPRIVLFPFHPVRSVKELLPESPTPPKTNAPPAMPPG